MSYRGDIAVGGTVTLWHYVFTAGGGLAAVTNEAVRCKRSSDDTTTTDGLTLSEVVAGQLKVRVNTAANGTFYAAGNDFMVELTAGEASGESLIGVIIGEFSIQNRSFATELGRLDAPISDLPTNAELATALGTADDAVLAAIAALNNLSSAQVRTAIGLASANLDTQLGDLPTAAENATQVLAAAAAAPIAANVEQINATPLSGTGVSGDSWRPT